MKNHASIRGAAALVAAAAAMAVGHAQLPVPLSPDWALPVSAAVSSAPGFNVRVAQANKNSGNLPNTIARAEEQIAGVLIDPKTGKPYANDIDRTAFAFDSNGIYTEPATIAYEQGGNAANGPIPGIPGVDGHNDNIALEAYTWLNLAEGMYTMVVNSDDGFRVTAGLNARDKINSVVIGEYDGGRGASDSVFKFSVSKAGLYSFRIIYFEGGGGANVSWFTADNNDSSIQTLLNDAGGLKAYRQVNANVAPYVLYARPGKNATGVSPSAGFALQVADGSPRKVNASSVKLAIDGAAVTPTVAQASGITTVSFAPGQLLPDPLSTHTAQLVFSDDGSPATSYTNTWNYTISKYTNIKLPAPLYYEDFESTTEGEIPSGWTRVNFTTGASGDYDLMNPNSDAFLDWLVLSRASVEAIDAAGQWEAARRLNAGENYVNGQRVKDLVQGKFAYAESDQRGGSQVQYLFTKDYDLTGKSSLYIAYNSIYEQNQDSIGSVEYSIDQGKTWLPILYMLDGPDIVLDSKGNVDAVATFTATNNDTASLTDPNTGEEIGKKYGAFIGAKISQALAPYISARVNDDPVESKRVEFFPIPAAANQKTVRFRFAQAGTASWYFGIDNFGIYSITVVDPPKINTSPANATAYTGLSFSLAVDASGTGLAYQWKKDGTAITGATGASYLVTSSKASDAGSYTVEVTNAGGKVTSAAATVTILSVPATIPFSDALAIYLPFDGNLVDASPSKANGTAVGAVTFESALFGQGVRVKNLKDGSVNNYVTLGYPAALKFGDSTDFTVSFWVKQLDQADDQAYISNKDWNSSNNQGWGVFSQGGKNYRVNITGPNRGGDKFSRTPGGRVGDGAWHNLIVTVSRSTSTVRSYLDGNLNDSATINTKGTIDTDALATPLSVNIGQDGTGTYTDGGAAQIEFVMDDLAIWRRALPADQVAAIYLTGAAGKPASSLAGSTTTVSTTPPTGLGGGSFSNVVIDEANKTITADLPASGDQGYLTISPARAIKSVEKVGGKLVIKY